MCDIPTTTPTSMPTNTPTIKPNQTPTINTQTTQIPTLMNKRNKKPVGQNGDTNIKIYNEYIIYGDRNSIENNNYFGSDILSNNNIIQCACFDINDILYSNNKCYIEYMGGKIIKTYDNDTSLINCQYIIDYDNNNCKSYKNNKLIYHDISIPNKIFNICINELNKINLSKCNYNANIIKIKALNDIKYVIKGNKGKKYQILFIISISLISLFTIIIICLIFRYIIKYIFYKRFKYTLIKNDSSLSSSNISQNEFMSEALN